MSVKIVHCADIHIGFNGTDKRYAGRRRGEVIQTFFKAVDFVKENAADLFLIAGDLFDNHKIGQETVNQVLDSLSGFSGRTFIIAGNHDYYGENTFWTKAEIPSNVTVLSGDEAILCEELGVRVFGSSFTGAYKNDFSFGEVKQDNYINIALLHGEMARESAYCPITEEDIKNSGMDYVALGHIHKRSEVLKAGSTHYAYCGCLEGQGFDETGEKGIYFGTVEKGNVSMKFIPLCQRQFVEERIDISEITQKSEVAPFILRKINEKYGDIGDNWLYKIVLTGETTLSISTGEVVTALENKLYFVKVKDKTVAPIGDLETIAQENSIKGIFAEKMLKRMKEGNKENAESALKLGLRSFFEEVNFDED